MHINEPDVCVIIAAFNAQETIGRAVKSALLQDHVREVFVVDDASQDDTANRARAQDDGSGRLFVMTSADNRGPAAARNVALQHSHSAYVCTLDSDDYFRPQRISRLVTAADASTWDMIADDILIVPATQQHCEFSVTISGPPSLGVRLDLETFVRGNISHPRRPRGELGFLKPIIKRRFLNQHGLRFDERLRLGEDYALYTRALLAGARFHVANACGYVAIERNESISSLHSATDLDRIAAFDAECLTLGPRLTSKERAALTAHRTATLRKYNHRFVLDCKRERGLTAALVVLTMMPASIPYIASETVRAKTTRVSGDNASKLGFRFLMGTRKAQLSLSGIE
jgi:succinoglycan biosynthesis protein ExoU